MSIWSDNPEVFDEWIEQRALEGEFGPDIQRKVEEGELLGWELWALPELQGRIGELGHRAEIHYVERLMP